jgi:hypothetical protein
MTSHDPVVSMAMSSPAPNQPLQDDTYLPDEDTAETIDFLSALRARGSAQIQHTFAKGLSPGRAALGGDRHRRVGARAGGGLYLGGGEHECAVRRSDCPGEDHAVDGSAWA